jgi:hypothetical protein
MPSALAAVPINDDITGAVTITTPLPFTYSESTVDATTSAAEAAFNSFCGAPKLEHGVWFTATPTTNDFIQADVTASDYSAGILVLSGSPGNLTPLNCQPGTVSGPVQAGVTYFLLVFGDGLLTTATSGNLVLKVSEVAPPPTVSVTVNKFGSVDKSGNALISGTVTCASTDGSGNVVDVSGTLRQTIGRIFIDGFFDTPSGAPCDNSTNAWQAVATGNNGKFAGGKAANVTVAVGCTLGGCTQSFVQATVQLRRNG